MVIKPDYIYRDQNGEYFQSEIDIKKDMIILKNPSYPFSFIPSALGDLEEIGTAKEFKHLIEKKDYKFHEGNELNIKINEEGNLEVDEENSNIEIIKYIEVTVTVRQSFWSVEEIYNLLKKIEKEENFKGFTEIFFKVGAFPKLKYFIDTNKENKNISA